MNQNRLELVVITATGCGSCDIFKYGLYPQLVKYMKQRTDISMRDYNLSAVSKSAIPEELNAYRDYISYFPTILLGNGTHAEVFNGVRRGKFIAHTPQYDQSLEGIQQWIGDCIQQNRVPVSVPEAIKLTEPRRSTVEGHAYPVVYKEIKFRPQTGRRLN